MFISDRSTWAQCTAFLKRAFNITKLSERTVMTRVKGTCGFRIEDFHRFPRDRNSEIAIQERYEYVPSKYGFSTLSSAVYYDEMQMTKNTKTGAWTIDDWRPTRAHDTSHEHSNVHFSLRVAASPELGVIHYEIYKGAVTGKDVLAFVDAMVTRYYSKFSSAKDRKRVLIMDSDRLASAESAYLKSSILSKFFFLEYLPHHSPFLNALEEVFVFLKADLMRYQAQGGEASKKRSILVEHLIEGISSLTQDRLMDLYSHTDAFLADARAKKPMFPPESGSHNTGFCPMLAREVELLLDSYSPETNGQLTTVDRALIEAKHGVKRLTKDLVEEQRYS